MSAGIGIGIGIGNASATRRIASIDAKRGLVMMIMTLDHVRETFFLHRQVSDPMDLATTEPSLFFTRLAAHFCAPMFVFLTGLSAYLYAHPAGSTRSATAFLLKRGLFLVLLELTLVNFAWSGRFPPSVLYLQVIWVIGLAMIVLGLVHRLPLRLLGAAAVVIVAAHNALPALPFGTGSWGSAAWTLLEQRGFLVSESALRIKVSYPLLPWIGIILLGYVAGPLFSGQLAAPARRRLLVILGCAALVLLALLRAANLYGEALPWSVQADGVHTVMSFLNLTKYPPSLSFTLMTLGVGMLVLAGLERANNRLAQVCAVYGGAPLFFYLLHLYALLALQTVLTAVMGQPHRADSIAEIWLWAPALIAALYLPCRWFGQLKRSSGKAWMRYL